METLAHLWMAAWPRALAHWSKFTLLKVPSFSMSAKRDKEEGILSSFAMIRLTDQTILISLHQVTTFGLDHFPEEIMAHEVGHHVYCPGNLDENARLLAIIGSVLANLRSHAPFIANLYADLLINDRLQRGSGLDMERVYAILQRHNPAGTRDPLWNFYMRVYEILWSLETHRLATGEISKSMEVDARLASRLIRGYSNDWLKGSRGFALLCLPYLLEQNGAGAQSVLAPLEDMRDAGKGGIPNGLSEILEEEGAGGHPAEDPIINGIDNLPEGDTSAKSSIEPVSPSTTPGGLGGQFREPFQYGQILEQLGIKMPAWEVAARYYRERAIPHLIPFPEKIQSRAIDPIPEGFENWEGGEDIAELDILGSLSRSPILIPGVTTVKKVFGENPGELPEKSPLDLDLYIDSSGSMPNPTINISYLTLAGAIIALSALRSGASVQVTLWSGTRQFMKTEGFTRDELEILRICTGFFGGATAFPIHVLRDTFQKPRKNPTHIMVISDDGVTTMLDKDEKGNSGETIADTALKNAGGGGTLALNIYPSWNKNKSLKKLDEMGYKVSRVSDWGELILFACEFSRRVYGEIADLTPPTH